MEVIFMEVMINLFKTDGCYRFAVIVCAICMIANMAFEAWCGQNIMSQTEAWCIWLHTKERKATTILSLISVFYLGIVTYKNMK